jgi:predicted NAD/FAD-dependent oxidoreductase
MSMKIAVVGAGIAGLQLAKRLSAQGEDVFVFEKARGPSGRLATRRAAEGQYDHGAQYFTARTPSFLAQVEEWRRRGVVERWHGTIVRLEDGEISAEQDAPIRYVGTPRMSVIARDLAVGIPTEFSVRIISVEKKGGTWTLESDDGRLHADFDVVVLAVPAPQAVPLLSANAPFAKRADDIRMLPCHALMVRFDSDLAVDFDAAFVRSSAIGWIARNGSKPGRETGANWVLHSTAEWSESNLDRGADEIRDDLLAAFGKALDIALPSTSFCAVHRWLLARPLESLECGPLWDRDSGLGACGDWTRGDRVEDAYLSAEALVDAMGAR